jgi:hypothetical protein
MTKIAYTPYQAFGWKVYKAVCPDGHSFIATTTKAGPRTDAANITLYTQGLLTGKALTDDQPVLNRPPGTYSQNLNPIREGQFEFTATGVVQWWCINYETNGNDLPNVTPVVMADAAAQSFPVGTKLFLVEGAPTVNGVAVATPACLQASTVPLEVVALGNVYGFVFLD